MLKPAEREKVQDCLLLIQSARNILSGLKPDTFPDRHELDKCFREADLKLNRLLRA